MPHYFHCFLFACFAMLAVATAAHVGATLSVGAPVAAVLAQFGSAPVAGLYERVPGAASRPGAESLLGAASWLDAATELRDASRPDAA